MARLRGKLENKKVTEPKKSKRGRSMRKRKPAGGSKTCEVNLYRLAAVSV